MQDVGPDTRGGAADQRAKDGTGEERVNAPTEEGGGRGPASSAGVPASYAVDGGGVADGRAAWDGALVLSLVSRTYKPIVELQGLCKGLDAMVPRRVCVGHETPEELVPRLLQQDQRKENKEHHFPAVKVRLGCSSPYGANTYFFPEMEPMRDSHLARALAMLPPNLEELECCYDLPLDLKHVIVHKVVFGLYFNSQVVLPPGAREVEFGGGFNKEVALPDGLEIVRFSGLFNQPLSLPAGLKVLEVSEGCDYNQPLSLPTGIRHVCLGFKFDQPLRLPFGAEKVRLAKHLSHPIAFPASLRRLELGGLFNAPLDLPDGLEVLEFGLGSAFNKELRLPPSIKDVSLGGYFNQPLERPAGLQRLSFASSSAFNHPIRLPAGLKDVTFGFGFQQAVRLPRGLSRARFDCNHDQPVELPEGEEDQWRVEAASNLYRTYVRRS